MTQFSSLERECGREMTGKIKESKSHGAMLSLVGESSRDARTHAIGQSRGEGGGRLKLPRNKLECGV